MRRLGDNFSTVTAPFVIVLTFGQTLGSLLDLECPWPNLLREWMQMLDIFNINLELARYDHACHRPLLSHHSGACLGQAGVLRELFREG